MAILTFDTSSKVCTVALGNKNKLLVEHTLNLDYTHSDHLLPLIKQALEIAKLKITDIEAIGVVSGPGSFTGLRIGLTVAKGLSLAAQCPVYTFTSLKVLAASNWGVAEPVISVIPAQRGEIYAGLFDCSDGSPQLKGEYFIGKLANEIKDIVSNFKSFYIVGSDYSAYEQEIEQLFNTKVIKTTPFHKVTKSALILPLVVEAIANNEEPCNIESVEPFYMRLSAAEQNRLEKEKKNALS